jgi:hypothetical protein
VVSIVTLKVSLQYNIGHYKCKEILSTKLQVKVHKNPTWPRITDVVSSVEQGLMAPLEKVVAVDKKTKSDPCTLWCG